MKDEIVAEAVVKSGGKNWYFLTADYTFGTTIEREAPDVVTTNGGTVLGSVRHPLSTTDFSAAEFGIVAGGQKLVGLVILINDIHALGLKSSNGLLLTTAFYWDLNDKTHAFAERFAKRNGG